MESRSITLLFLVISAFCLQTTHQYRLSKRELTEYDLTSFIVSSCSADKTDVLIQTLCDQTLQSALTGNFPYLIYYCKSGGVGMSFCNDINQYASLEQHTEAKRFAYRRLVRSVDNDGESHHEQQSIDIDSDSEQKFIMRMCVTNREKNSIEMDQFCNQAAQAVQRGQYPGIQLFCKFYSDVDYCRHVQSYSSSLSGSSSSKLPISPLLSPSLKPFMKPSFALSPASITSEIKSNTD